MASPRERREKMKMLAERAEQRKLEELEKAKLDSLPKKKKVAKKPAPKKNEEKK